MNQWGRRLNSRDVRYRPASVISDDVLSCLSINGESAVSWTHAAVDQGVADDLTVGRDYDKSWCAPATYIEELIIKNVNVRAFDPNTTLSGAPDGVVSNGHVTHSDTVDVNTIAHDIGYCPLSLAANNRIPFDQDLTDVGSASGSLYDNAVSRGGQLGIPRVDQVVPDNHILQSVLGFVDLQINVGAAGTVCLSGNEELIVFEQNVPAVNEREILRGDASKLAIDYF